MRTLTTRIETGKMIVTFKIDFQLTNCLRGSHTLRAGKLFCHILSDTPYAARRIAAER